MGTMGYLIEWECQPFREAWKKPLVLERSEALASMDKQTDQKRVDSGSSLFRRLILRQVADNVLSDTNKVLSDSSRRLSESSQANGSRQSNGCISLSSDEYVGDDGSLLSLRPLTFKKENSKDGEERSTENHVFSGRCGYDFEGAELSPRSSISVRRRYERNQNLLRSRRSCGHDFKPLTSMENCLIPSLYSEHFEIEEYVFSSDNSQNAATLRPFIVTNGSKVISKSGNYPSAMLLDNGFQQGVNGISAGLTESVTGVPALPESRGSKRKSKGLHYRKSNASDSQTSSKLSHAKGPLDGMFLFCLGISIGMHISSNRREVEKLSNLLKHTENLVQDLQEELEMKDSLSVKELANENCGNQEPCHGNVNAEESAEPFKNQVPASHSPACGAYDFDKSKLPKTVHDLESMSKIEAELEAELERLELNINSSYLEQRMSAFGELDLDRVAEVVHGELRTDALHPGAQNGHGGEGRDSSSTSTTHTDANYAVSPRELSLRLHEVIQSRLEERLKELEQALDHSQKQIQLMEVERVLSHRDFSNSDLESSSNPAESSSNQVSPTVLGQDDALSHPLCLNLSGDALSAYNEAYEEFMKMGVSEEKPSLYAVNRSLIWGGEDDNLKKPSANINILKRVPTWEQILRSSGANDTDESDNDIGDEGKMLIKQIVEKTRQGSPVLMQAQRMLLLMDE